MSWSNIHDHYKASLISSGDEQLSDTVIRATYHHNYFHDCGSRLPSIRFDMRLSRESAADKVSGRVGADPSAILKPAASIGNRQSPAPAASQA